MEPEKVHLTGEKQTLLITLYAKAMESRSPDSLLKDRFADQALARIDYDFKPLDLGPDGAISLAMRAKAFDDWTRAFIEKHPNAVVLNLGCGLDSRVFRVDPPPEIAWFDVDFPDVIEIRQRVYPERGRRLPHDRRFGRPIHEWLEQMPARPAGDDRRRRVDAVPRQPMTRRSWWRGWSRIFRRANWHSTAIAGLA